MPRQAVTEALRDWRRGDPSAEERLTELVYDELRSIAARYLRAERAGHTLEPTALVHEVYLRLVGQRGVEWHERGQFFAVAARMMRRVLLDHARRRLAERRGAGKVLPLVSSLDLVVERPPDLVALDEALSELAEFDPEKARLVELRFFGGLTVDETAHALDCSRATVVRQWRTARAWLFQQIGGSSPS